MRSWKKLLGFVSIAVFAVVSSACSSTGDAGEDEATGAVSGQTCGGIGGLLCPRGFVCKMTATHPDASGTCERLGSPQPPRCGGFAGLQCPSGMECKLDPCPSGFACSDQAGHCEAIPVWDRCTTDRDCVAVPVQGCCDPNGKEAVHKRHVAAYEASFDERICLAVDCAPPPPPSTTRFPYCNTGSKRCEMVELKDVACGGHSPNPHACPEGFQCEGPGLAVDAPGACAPTQN
jgi:hypothetical protein